MSDAEDMAAVYDRVFATRRAGRELAKVRANYEGQIANYKPWVCFSKTGSAGSTR